MNSKILRIVSSASVVEIPQHAVDFIVWLNGHFSIGHMLRLSGCNVINPRLYSTPTYEVPSYGRQLG